MKRQRTITYWEFSIDIVGPRFRTKAQRTAIRKVLSRKKLKGIEQVALQIAKAKLPAGFTATVS